VNIIWTQIGADYQDYKYKEWLYPFIGLGLGQLRGHEHSYVTVKTVFLLFFQ